MISLHIDTTAEVIQGRDGEVVVVVTNNSPVNIGPMRITLTSEAAGLLVTPSAEHGGYFLAEGLPANKSTSRPFALRAVRIDAGRTPKLSAKAICFAGNGITLLPPQSQPMVATHDIKIKARPEVYAVLGAAETLRSGLSELYEQLKKTGEESEAIHETHLAGGRPTEPLKVALGEQGFRWALSMVELGTRLYRVQADSIDKDPKR